MSDVRSRGAIQLSTRSYLVALVVALLIPVLLFAGLLLWRVAESERGGHQRQALEAALRIAEAVDLDLSVAVSALQVLSTSPYIAARDHQAFREQAAKVSGIIGSDIVLKELTGQHQVNTRLPPNVPLPSSLPDADRQAIATKKPYVSDLFTGVTTGTPMVSIVVPILQDKEVASLLATRIDPSRLAELLKAQSLPPSWTAAIVDRAGRIIARSRDHEEYLGTMATDDLRRHTTGQAGVWTGETVEGTPVLAAYARSPLSDWRAAVGVPVEVIEGPLYRSLEWLMLVGALALVVSILLAGLLARRMAQPMGSLAEAAARLGKGEPVDFRSTGVSEIDEIATALRNAAADLRHRSAERDEAERALRENTARLERVLNTSPVGIMEVNSRGEFTYLNRAAQDILRLDHAALIGRRYDSTGWSITTLAGEPFDPKDLPAARALRGQASTNLELAVVDAGHTQRIVLSVNAAPVFDHQGRVESGLISFVEITQRRIAEEALLKAQAELEALNESLESQVAERTRELVEANERLMAEVDQREKVEEQLRQAQKMESVGQLTGGIAHDFNNLLAVIGGNLQLLQRRLERGQTNDLSRFIESARDGVNRASMLTNRLLAFARQQPLSPKAIDVNQLVAGMSELLRRSIGENIRIDTVLAEALWRTHADPNQLENAILNLALNARDAMPDGGKLTIETTNRDLDTRHAADTLGAAPGEYVMIAVSDTGFGIPRHVLDKVFDPFFTTKPTGQGTGLGLSQVYGFIRQSGGHVEILSDPGQGTTVRLYLPRYSGSEGETRTRRRTREAPERGTETVLVVEDDEAVRRMSVAALSELGYDVIEAGSATAALHQIDTRPEIRLLFTDLIMPDVNGHKLAAAALSRRPELKILLTTGYAREAVVQHGAASPGLQLIPKPFTVERLAAKVREVLDAPD
jgi:PAS domain S-box-containing protein